MKNLDLLSKRILIIAISISSLFLSLGFLILSTQKAVAYTNNPGINGTRDYNYEAISSGDNFFIWNTRTGTYKTTTGKDTYSTNW